MNNLKDINEFLNEKIIEEQDSPFVMVKKILKWNDLEFVKKGGHEEELAREIVNSLIHAGYMK